MDYSCLKHRASETLWELAKVPPGGNRPWETRAFIVLPTIHSSAGVVSTAFAEGSPKDWKSEKLTFTLSCKGTGSGEIEGTRVADLC